MKASSPRREVPFGGAGPALTPGEVTVLELVAEGLPTKKIAARLYVSRQAVTYHVGNLLAKLQCGNRAGLVARAFVLGVLSTDRWPPSARRDASFTKHPDAT